LSIRRNLDNKNKDDLRILREPKKEVVEPRMKNTSLNMMVSIALSKKWNVRDIHHHISIFCSVIEASSSDPVTVQKRAVREF
jgi:hypothetical protein